VPEKAGQVDTHQAEQSKPRARITAESLFDQAFGVYSAAGETFDVTRSGIVTQGRL
jgi:hypothetical protein